MKKYWYIFLGLLTIPCLISAQNTISILYFDNTTADPEYQWLSKGLADMLISDLSGLQEVKIIERASLEKVLEEQALSLTGLTDQGSAVEVGKLLQANQLIYGAYILNDDIIRIDIKLVSVESSAILYAFDVRGDIEDIFELETELVTNFSQQLNLKEQPVPKQPETKSVEALASYYIAIDHLDHKRYTQAESEFIRATELDPLFYRAQEGLADAYKFLNAFKKHRQQREIAQLYAKVNNLRERIEAPKFFTFADIVMSPQYQALTPEQQQEWNAAHNEYLKILYIQLLAYYSQEDYQHLKSKSEEFLITYPDYRMIETVEGWYEKSLEELSRN
jgi:TolB-like protein